ncbi:hypothetical protein CC78DRAFT_619390 [Lojkania enalia]|uniref:Uncharacterized protein n=1 Tax=Lojkania enalia TaxID=147567 RepID=A0A9P4K4U1_9PLEO|nr:hypothetical protein CC78DRAFT_619390 [Didymosphaeria enalia]
MGRFRSMASDKIALSFGGGMGYSKSKRFPAVLNSRDMSWLGASLDLRICSWLLALAFGEILAKIERPEQRLAQYHPVHEPLVHATTTLEDPQDRGRAELPRSYAVVVTLLDAPLYSTESPHVVAPRNIEILAGNDGVEVPRGDIYSVVAEWPSAGNYLRARAQHGANTLVVVGIWTSLSIPIIHRTRPPGRLSWCYCRMTLHCALANRATTAVGGAHRGERHRQGRRPLSKASRDTSIGRACPFNFQRRQAYDACSLAEMSHRSTAPTGSLDYSRVAS